MPLGNVSPTPTHTTQQQRVNNATKDRIMVDYLQDNFVRFDKNQNGTIDTAELEDFKTRNQQVEGWHQYFPAIDRVIAHSSELHSLFIDGKPGLSRQDLAIAYGKLVDGKLGIGELAQNIRASQNQSAPTAAPAPAPTAAPAPAPTAAPAPAPAASTAVTTAS